jgi:hypothetical protein
MEPSFGFLSLMVKVVISLTTISSPAPAKHPSAEVTFVVREYFRDAVRCHGVMKTRPPA